MKIAVEWNKNEISTKKRNFKFKKKNKHTKLKRFKLNGQIC